MESSKNEDLSNAIKVAVEEVVKARRVLATRLSDLGQPLEQAGVR